MSINATSVRSSSDARDEDSTKNPNRQAIRRLFLEKTDYVRLSEDANKVLQQLIVFCLLAPLGTALGSYTPACGGPPEGRVLWCRRDQQEIFG